MKARQIKAQEVTGGKRCVVQEWAVAVPGDSVLSQTPDRPHLANQPQAIEPGVHHARLCSSLASAREETKASSSPQSHCTNASVCLIKNPFYLVRLYVGRIGRRHCAALARVKLVFAEIAASGLCHH